MDICEDKWYHLLDMKTSIKLFRQQDAQINIQNTTFSHVK